MKRYIIPFLYIVTASVLGAYLSKYPKGLLAFIVLIMIGATIKEGLNIKKKEDEKVWVKVKSYFGVVVIVNIAI